MYSLPYRKYFMQHLIKKSREFLERNLGIIPRKKHLDQLTYRIDIGLVTVVTGMRRTGKSLLIVDYLQKLDTKKVFYFSKEFDVLSEVNTVSDLQTLFNLYTSIHGEPTHIVIDEIQDIAEWEKFIRAVFAEKRYKIVITGSNAHLLSGELATFLSGRYIPVHVAPLTYNEFLLFTKRRHTEDTVREYLFYGGLPEITKISLIRDKESYLEAITDSVLLKDIITRHQVRDSAVLRRILSFFADNVGSLTTLRNISNYFNGQRITFSFPTILNYVSHFKEACIIKELRRYDIR
jgi:predicted AAA+ superfamily ATPase